MAIPTAACSDLTGRLQNNALVRCEAVSHETVTGDGSLTIVELSEEES